MTELAPINVCHNRKNEPRLYLELCKCFVSLGHRGCMKKASGLIRCPIARELLAEIKEAQ